VVLIGRGAAKLDAVHGEIAAAGAPEGSIALLDLDRAVARDYDVLAEALLERYGRLDGLLHNAGLLGTLAPIEHYDVPTWCRVLHVNVTAAFVLTQVLLPALKKSRDASVVLTASSVGRRGRAYWGAYAVSKFALEGLSQVLSDELEGISHIRVNTLNPGRARTAMRRQAYPAEDLNTVPLPETLTAAYIALLGPASRGVTGGAFDAQPPAPPSSAAAASSPDSSARSSS
jgi:NAD(P)-dependent dehydrogenase (short-subunit alcohol dehydrogenase family)